jgi:vitamin B12 transporter
MNKGLLFLLFTVSSAGVNYAQTDTTTRALDEVTVTANRFPQKQQTTGKVVTIIPRNVIDQAGGMTLTELLSRQAGIFIAGSNNNTGTNQDVYLRGAATGNTLILLDGVPMYDVSTINNTFDLNHLPLESIERIEILKGAQSTVYGSDAVAGVIHIITRKTETNPMTVFGSVLGGSFHTLRTTAGIRGQVKKTRYQLQYQDNRSEGFSAAFDSSAKGDFDKDGFRQQVLSAQAGTQIGRYLSWQANGLYGRYKTDLDGAAYRDEKDFTAENTSLQAGTGLIFKRDGYSIHSNYQYSYLKRAYLDDSIFIGGFSKFSNESYEGISHFTELYGKFRINKQIDVLAGMDHRMYKTDQSFYSISSWGPYESNLSADTASVRLTSAYASAFWQNGKGLHMELGGRYNRHSRFGDNFTFTINPSFLLNDTWKFFFNLSSAFKAPSLYQLYDASVGQPELRPETSFTSEAGMQYRSRNRALQTRLVFFARDIRDGIDFNYVDYRYFNYNRQRAGGIELECEYQKKKWSFSQQYAFTVGEVNTVKYRYDASTYSYVPEGDTTYNNLFRRPKHSLNLSAGYQLTEKLFVRINARFIGMRYEPRFMDSPIELDAYQIADLYASYAFIPALRIFADVRNIFDTRYFDVAGFNTRGRTFMTGLSFSFHAFNAKRIHLPL